MTQDSHEPADETVSAHPETVPADDETVRVPPSDPAGTPPPPPSTPPPPPPGAQFPPPAPGAGFPPPGGFPPPPGAGFPPPRPTGGWTTRYGLVRPVQGKVFAGVCAALGRATNTDPVLWRVILAVLTFIGGIGLLVYFLGWMLIPREGDTASPAEAVIGRGRSSTNPVLAVIICILVLLGITSSFTFRGFPRALLVAALIGGIVLLVSRATGNRGTPPVDPYPYSPPPADVPPTVAYPAAPPADPATGYRPPFAPYGPYASSPYTYPGLAPAPPPVTPVQRPPSRLGRFTFSLMLLVLGVVALVDVLTPNTTIPAAAYFAAALATVGLGLLVGAWFGRARGLIALGIVLTVGLAIAAAANGVHRFQGATGDMTWRPSTIADVSDQYSHGFGDAELDLSQVDFTGQNKTVTVKLNAGNLHVILPPNVDTEVSAKVTAGNAQVFDTNWDGVNTPRRTVVDNGPDGVGGGHLTLDITLTAGDLEVAR